MQSPCRRRQSQSNTTAASSIIHQPQNQKQKGPNATVFAYAAAQVKKAMDVTQLLGGSNYVFW